MPPHFTGKNYPTPYPDVNAVLDRLRADVQAVLGDHFAGLYLYGSLASGDFNPQTSDIDFLVMTNGALPAEKIAALDTMHAGIMASGLKWAKKLEGSYLPQAALWRYDPDGPAYPTLNEGRFYLAPHGSDWIIQRHIIREHGVALAGPPPQPLIAPVTPDDLRGAVQGILAAWWLPMLDHSEWLGRSDDYPPFAVLTMCRALHTLEYGDIASKPVAARWTQAAHGEPWAALIGRALTWRHGDVWGGLDQTLAFMRHTLARANVR
jgi:hypothetical protein